MAHAFPDSSPSRMVRDKRTGQLVEVRGLGALKGTLRLKPGVDLTKPILEQVAKAEAKADTPSDD